MLNSFRSSPYFLLVYHAINIVFYGTSCFLLQCYWSDLSTLQNGWMLLVCIFLMVLPSFKWIAFSSLGVLPVAYGVGIIEPQLWQVLLLPLGIWLGLLSSFLMHNATHLSIRPRWINRVVGELCGLHQLMGFPAWAIAHIIHHQYPDDPEKDPHPPEFLSFPTFTNQMGISMGRVMTGHYMRLWGTDSHSKLIWRSTLLLSTMNRYLRGLFLLLLAGPSMFVLLFIPSKFWSILLYAHFNYYTHRPDENGAIEILNLNHTVPYKLLNALSWGSYFHKNHHQNPSLFDPRTLPHVRIQRHAPMAVAVLQGENNHDVHECNV